jgi:vacuolar iron transporter family protein
VSNLQPEDRQALGKYFGRRTGRQPYTTQQAGLEKKRNIRGLVFGLQDGILSCLGVLAGLDAAVGSHWAALVAAYECTLMGMLSMGVGEYLGSRAESHVVDSVIRDEKHAFATDPEAEFLEQVEFLKTKGFTDSEAHLITRRLAQNPEVWLAENLADEYGINPGEAAPEEALRNGVVLGGAFGLGSVLPTMAYQFLPHPAFAALVTGIVCLFVAGWVSGTVSRSSPIRRALELVLTGLLLFGITWAGGNLRPSPCRTVIDAAYETS